MKKQRIAVAENVLTVEYPTINKKLVVDLGKYPAVVQDCARIHGFKQKFGDAASGGTPVEKFAMVNRIHASLLAGEWELTATPDNSGIIIEAVCRIKKIPAGKLEKSLEKLPEADRDAKVKEWAANAKVKATIAQIRAERAAKAAEETNEDIDIEV